MAKASLNDLSKYTRGGKFFKIEDGEQKNVRFLYNTVEEVVESAISVHEFSGTNFATIDCARQDGDPIDACKWCLEYGKTNPAVLRVVLPMYEEATGEIVYWKRSASFVQDNLVPLFSNLPVGAPISGQSFVIARKGKAWNDTKYTISPDMRVMNDNKTADQFGEIQSAYDLNMIRPADTDFDPNNQSNNNAQQAGGFQPRQPNRAAGIF